METVTAHKALRRHSSIDGIFIQGRLTGQEGRRPRVASLHPPPPAPHRARPLKAMRWERFQDLGMEQEALVKVAGVLALGSELRLPPTCAACLVEVGLPGRHTESAESSSSRPGGRRRPLPPRVGQGCLPAPTSIFSGSLGSKQMPLIDMTSISPQFMARPRDKILLPGVYRQLQVEIFEILFSTLKIHRHFTSYPILCSCMFFKKFYLFIYFWLHWVFVAAHGLSLVAASGDYSSLWCTGFSLRWLLLSWGMGSRHAGFSSCNTQAQ